jgi:hypothetical protein
MYLKVVTFQFNAQSLSQHTCIQTLFYQAFLYGHGDEAKFGVWKLCHSGQKYISINYYFIVIAPLYMSEGVF